MLLFWGTAQTVSGPAVLTVLKVLTVVSAVSKVEDSVVGSIVVGFVDSIVVGSVDVLGVEGIVVVSWDGISDIILVLSVLSSVLVSGFVNTTEVVESIPDVEAEIRNEKE